LQQAINLEELKKQKEQVGQYVVALEKQLPSKSEMDALLSDINQAGIGRGLSFNLFKPGQSITKEYYAELPIQIAVKGSYHDFGSFAADIANLPRIVTLEELDIKSEKNTLNMVAIAKTYRYLDAEELNSQKQEAARQANKAGGKNP
jgi:type IV pilus assembly protein PilO